MTSYGEIPVTQDDALASRILELTRQLFDACKYHGIYGVEWLRDSVTDESFLIDVNARPFSSIGHLADSGINLPYLACKEVNKELNTVLWPKSAKHTFWINFSSDTFSAVAHVRQKKDLSIMGWIRQVICILADTGPGAVFGCQLPLLTTIGFTYYPRWANTPGEDLTNFETISLSDDSHTKNR